MTRNNHHLQINKDIQFMNIKKKNWFQEVYLKARFYFRHNIRVNTMLGVGCVCVIWIPCSCSECLRKLDYPKNRRQYKYSQDRYKGENQQCVYWPILGS